MLAKSVSESGILKSEQGDDPRQMNAERTPDSSIPFIDEGEIPEEGQKSTQRQYNLTITRNYQNRTRRVEISKILQDGDPINQRSLSPLAPLAKDTENLTDDEQDKRETVSSAAEFELTIRSDNSIIRIQGFDNKSAISFDSAKGTGDNMYDFLSTEVNKIFRKPERQEIEKAVRSLTNGDVPVSCEEIVRPKKNWKVLTKSIMNLRSGKSAGGEQRRGSIERYPKIVLLQDAKPPSDEGGYPKMVMFDETKAKKDNKTRMPKKSTPEDEEESVNGESLDKKEVEDVCIEVEELPPKEETMEKETEAPQKKKKQLHQFQTDKKRGCFCQGCKSLARSPFKVSTNYQNLCFHNFSESEESGRPSVPAFCHYPGHCPSMYIPVYDRQVPYYPHNPGGFHCGGRFQDTATQTAEADLGPYCEEGEEPKDLPFSFLSSFFPRIVVMKSFQEQVPGEDTETKISELPKSESPISTPENEKEDEKECGKLESEEEIEELPFAEDLQEKEGDHGKREDNLQVSNDSSDEIVETAIDELSQVTNDELPLTKLGYSIYDKLNELAMERKEKETKGEVTRETQNERKPSPRSITFQFKNRLVNFQLREGDCDSNSNLQIRESGDGGEGTNRKCVTSDKMLVAKSELWYPSNGGRIRNGETSGKGIDAISFSVTEKDKIVFSIEMGEEAPERRTKEAKVGTDGLDVIGGDFIQRGGNDKKDLSPRTDEVLKLLRHKLEAAEGIKNENLRNQDLKFPGLFLIQPIDSRRGFPSDDYIMTKERKWRKSKEATGKAREYYCEDCLATMRVLEDEKPSVKNIVDKFETIIHLGSY